MAAELLILGTAAGVGGNIVSGIAGSNQASFQADVANQNARAERQRAESQAQIQARRNRRLQGQTRAALGASGLSSTGSQLDLLADQVIEQEQELNFTRLGGAIRAREQRGRARLFNRQASGALVQGIGQAGGTALTGFGLLNNLN